MLKRVLTNGLPAGFQNSIISVANVFVQANINQFGDELGDNRRKGGSAHPMMEHADEN